jgi:hypothetical protein
VRLLAATLVLTLDGGAARAEVTARDIVAMVRQVCMNSGGGLAMITAGKTFETQSHWRRDEKVPQKSHGLVTFDRDGNEVKPLSMEQAAWDLPTGEGSGRLLVQVFGKDEFPTLDFDSCTFTFDGDRTADVVREIQSQLKLGPPIKLQPGINTQLWRLDGGTATSFPEVYIEGYRMLGVSLQRMTVATAADAEPVLQQVASLPTPVPHRSIPVTVVAVANQHIPKEVMDNAGSRIYSMFP